MKEILEALRDGDHSIVDVFVEANALWREIMSDFDTVPVSELATRLQNYQPTFERLAGDRHLGKVLLGISGYTHLYSCAAGFGHNSDTARKLRDTIEASYCAAEVKAASKATASIYPVED